MRRRAVVAAGLGLLFVVLAVVMTFPNPTRLLSHTAGDLGDPQFTQWTMRWDFHALLTDPIDVFDPNIYWPYGSTLAYSDTLLAVAPISGILGAVLGWPLTYNVLYLACWVASLAATYVLAHWLTGRRDASVLAALVFTFAAARLTQYTHFQLGFAFLIPLALWLLLRFLVERKWWQPAALGVALAAMFLQAVYHALILYVAVVVLAVGWLVAERSRPGRRFVRGMALAGLVTVVLAGPAAYKYRAHGDALKQGYFHNWAAHPGDLVAPAEGSHLYASLDRWATRGGRSAETRMFPGVVAAGLGVVGAYDLWRRRRSRRAPDGDPVSAPGRPVENTVPSTAQTPLDDRLRRRGLLLLLLAGAVALVLAFGRYQVIGDTRVALPYTQLREWVPGFESVRVLARFVVVPLLALAVLVAVGFSRLVARWPERAGALLAAAVGTVMLAEYAVEIPMSARVDRPELAAVNHALKRLPDGPVLELPMGDATRVVWGVTEPPRMVLSAIDWKPRINGYSGHFPPGYVRTVDLTATLANGRPAHPEVLAELRRLGVRYVVVRTAPMAASLNLPGVTYYDEAAADRVSTALPADLVEGVTRHGAAVLIRLRPS